jgi:putative methyltransferase (TIGR04325 family)
VVGLERALDEMSARGPTRRLFTAQPLRRGFHKLERLLPPVVTGFIRHSLSEWDYVSDKWPAMGVPEKGWSAESVVDGQQAHWPILVGNLAGTGPLGVSHLPSQLTRDDPGDHNAMMSYGYVLARAGRDKQQLRVLDWGGGAGHYFLYSQILLPEVVLDYHCYELPSMCRLGRKLVPEAQFHEDAQQLTGPRFDLVISSSALHYFEDWQATARLLSDWCAEYLYLARLQTVSRSPSFVVRQRPYGQGYDTEYLSWFLNRGELTGCLESLGLELVREFVYAENWTVKRAPEAGECRGFLFRRRSLSAQEQGERPSSLR